MRRLSLLAITALALGLAPAARADEGMWTYDNFPTAQVKKKYGFEATQAWLDSARRSSLRIAGGCSASFVSENGLVMTNHHCVRSCLLQLSGKGHDYATEGFNAQIPEQEVRCPEIELNELLSMTDVTKKVAEAVKGLKAGSPEYAKKQKEAKTLLEKECSGGDDKLRCEVIDLYHGGIFSLYKFHRYQDVRVVFAPEQAAAHFGGDPDNFSFPRYALDMSFLRAWENGKPVKPEHWFKWSEAGPKEGELVFVSGNPGSTRRLPTVSQYQELRDYTIPEQLIQTAQWRGVLEQFVTSSEEHAHMAKTELLGIDNTYKGITGRYAAIREPKFMAQKMDEEKKLRAKIKAKAALAKSVGDAYERIAKAEDEFRPHRREYALIEGMVPTQLPGVQNARTVMYARTLVRLAAELQKPDGERLREYRDSALPSVKQALFSKAPLFPDFEKLKIAYGLTKLREDLGPDHVFVKKILGKRSPEEIAEEIATKSELRDPEVRKKLFEGGAAAIAASNDPAIVLARAFDDSGRPLRKWYEDSIEAGKNSGSEAIAQARFAIEGTSTYPDATFTLRLSYGTVKGWESGGRVVKPFTDFAGLYDRATGREPFKLAASIEANKDHVKLSVPLDFSSDNDIIGGNSGSPLINQNQEIVGLAFDGNLPSLGGDYFFDPAENRTVSVHSAGMLEALQSIYGAKRVVEEIRPAKAAGGAGQK
ncbi:MAG: S46 family peptidase [Deltaproteobacteria bacterium]|nr:S46 family peptidase [Deltaproteobacteria bacterium]